MSIPGTTRKPLVRRTPIGRGTVGLSRPPFQTKPRSKGRKRGSYSRLRRVGRNSHSQDWRRRWPKLKRAFERDGITRCERCGSDYFLTPAHSLKRRHITNETQMDEVALLCQPCHETLELSGEAKMYPAICDIIANRPNRLTEAA